MNSILRYIAPVCLLASSSYAAGAQLVPISYDMLNGETGYLVYHDQTYSGTGDKNSDLAPLSGGAGDLTDGILGDQWGWFSQPQADPWVGWRYQYPAITFDFGTTVEVSQIVINTLRNTPASVYIPSKFTVSSGATADTLGSAADFTFNDSDYSDLALHTLTLYPVDQTGRFFQIQTSGIEWAIYSEIQFFGVPEPSTLGLACVGATGLGIAVGARRRSARRLPRS